MNPYALAAGAKAGSSVWKDKTGRIILLGGLGVLSFLVLRTVGKVATGAGNILDTANTIIGLPKKFFENLTVGWNQQSPGAEAKANFANILNTIKINEKKLSYNASTYLTAANNLYEAMDGWNVGNQLSKIETILKGMNDDDFKATYVAFGLRRASRGVGQEYENLTQWLQDDLKESNYNTLRNRFKASGLL